MIFCEICWQVIGFFGMLVQRASLEYRNFVASSLRYILFSHQRVTVCECPQVCLCVYILDRKGTFRVEHWVKGPFFLSPPFPLLSSPLISDMQSLSPSSSSFSPYSVWIRGSMDVNAMFFSVFSMKIPPEQLLF